MADINYFLKKYKNFKSTFKETSFDDRNGQYLCRDESQEVINFDNLIKDRFSESMNIPKSFDAVFIRDNIIFLVEFKNEKKPEKEAVKEKLIQGKTELDIIPSELNISKRKYRFIFCLVYRIYKPKHERFKRGLYKSIVYESLNKYKKIGLADDIYTEGVDFFTKEFKKHFNEELTC